MNDARTFVSAGGHRLEYRWIAGNAERPTLIFLHEGMGSLAMWKDFPDALANATDCPALVYSRYGYGWSDTLTEPFQPDYMHREAGDALPDLMRAFEVDRPVLIGHSDGASIALIAAGEGTIAPGALILEAPHVFVEDVTIASIEAARETFSTTDLAERMAPYHRDPKSSFQGWNDIWLNPDFRDWNIEKLLPAIACPIQIIQGEDDEYGTSEQIRKIEAQISGPWETRILADCRHSPHRDQRELTLQTMAAFIGKL